MCGITGFMGTSAGIDQERLSSMRDSMVHRGPDDAGIWVSADRRMGLAHRRLSIIDLSSSARQPMFDKESGVAVVYNGEVYNFLELRKELESLGTIFRTHSDTEVVLKAYVKWGTKSFSRFNGMFALGIWDPRKQELHLARDRFGIKPLYYWADEKGSLIFGSEIKAILASGAVDARINWEALLEYLHHGYTIHPNTIFHSIQKLSPGHRLVVSASGIRQEAYWSIENVLPIEDDFPTATKRIRELLIDAVRDHLISDVPLGIFLSGGVDSSTLTALASRHSVRPVKTFSVGFDFGDGVNELPKARQVAEHFSTDHHELRIAGKSVPRVMEKLIGSHDEPFAEAGNIPLYMLSEELQGSVKVILQGDGGDEIFAGYPWHYGFIARPWFWKPLARICMPCSAFLGEGLFRQRVRCYLEAAGERDPSLRVARVLARGNMDVGASRALSEEGRREVAPYDPFIRYRELDKQFAGRDPIWKILFTDFKVNLPNSYFEKVDKPTMAHGIENRVPFLDTRLTNYVMSLPSSYLVQGNERKYILRKAMRGILPDMILDGPKSGFGVPWSFWLRTSLLGYLRSILFDPQTLAWGLLDGSQMEKCIREHVNQKRDNGRLLYRLLNLALWYHRYLRRN